MARVLLIYFSSFLSVIGYGQQSTIDISISSKQATQSLNAPAKQELPAPRTVTNGKLDSLESLARISRFKDSLKISGWSDSMRIKINDKFSNVIVTRKMDSLRRLQVPAERITQQSDSLFNKKEELLAEVSGKQQKLQKSVTIRYDEWTTRVRQKFNLDSAGLKIPGLDSALPVAGDPFQNAKVPTTSLPLNTGLPNIPFPSADVPAIPTLQSQDFSDMGISKDLSSLGGSHSIPSTEQLGNWDKSLPSVSNPLQEITRKTEELKALKSNPGDAAEKAVGQIGEVSEATKTLQEAEQLKQKNEALEMAEKMKDPEAVKETAKQEALNHFQGQEAALQGAMSQMSKFKKKYPSLGSLSEIKKNDWLPRNGLKGKPFRERLRIGLHTGFKSASDTLLLDLYPNASYRLTGRFEAGLGAIYRVRVSTKHFGFDQHDPVWGLASFVVVKTFKSIFLRLELDGNSFPKSGTTDKPYYRDWKWSFHSGIQTNFKIGKQWTGIIQMLYSFDSNLKDGFPEKLALRFGVQYKLPKKAVTKSVS